MSAPSRDGGGGGDNLQLVPSDAKGVGGVVSTKPPVTGGELVVAEAGKSGVVLREDEEDLEVKLRRIMENVPVRVSNTSGSSAGSGSGDFHQYRQMRRKEQDRLARMDADYQRRKEIAEFNKRREERIKAADERTAKKRLKRQKKKQRRRGKKTKADDGVEEANKNQSSDTEDSDDTDEEEKQ